LLAIVVILTSSFLTAHSEECGPELSILTLMQMDEQPENQERIGCYVKCEITNHAELYNGSFHIEEGFFENIVANISGDCFNSVAETDFSCTYFYNVWSCFKGYLIKSKEAVDAISKAIRICKPHNEKKITKNDYQCVPKCVFERLGFSGATVFDVDGTSSWFRSHFPPQFGRMLAGIVDTCYAKTNLRYSGSSNLDCKYFYKFFKCYVLEFLRGLLEIGDTVPRIKGFTFDL